MVEYGYDKASQRWGSSVIGDLENTYRLLWANKRSYQYGVLRHICETIKDGDSIIDVGCFNGHYLNRIRNGTKKKFKYLGTDVTPAFIERAKVVNAKDANASFEVGDIFNLKYHDNAFDLVICSGVLIHLPEIARPISELGRISRRDLIMLVQDAPKTVNAPYNGFLNWYFSEDDMRSAISGAGLTLTRTISPQAKYKIYHCTKS